MTQSTDWSKAIDATLASLSTPSNPILRDKSISPITADRFLIQATEYQVVEDYRQAFDLEMFANRYEEYFEKFDYLVGDISADQLRLKGFYQLNTRWVPRNQIIDLLEVYLREECNFGCRYFVVGKTASVEAYPKELEAYQERVQRHRSSKPRRRRSNRAKKTQHQFTKRQKPHQEAGPKVKTTQHKKGVPGPKRQIDRDFKIKT